MGLGVYPRSDIIVSNILIVLNQKSLKSNVKDLEIIKRYAKNTKAT